MGDSGPALLCTAIAYLSAGDGLLGFTVRESESARLL